MSLYDYRVSQKLDVDNSVSFYSLIMAAMRRADTDNEQKLRSVFPEVWEELERRYNAPGGSLTGDPL